jgi:hypothetical protein
MKPKMQGNFYIALLHYPVYDKNREVVTTALTPMDLHDIARAGRTYGVQAFYLVTPLRSQRILARLIIDHWNTGWGATYNPNRKDALTLARIVETLEEVIAEIAQEWGTPPRTVATGARLDTPDLSFEGLAERINNRQEAYLVLFGTGWGLVEETIRAADFRLQSIRGRGDYNHLSVRSAASIILDRVMGKRY